MKKYLILFLIFALMCSTTSAFAGAYMPANNELSVMIGEFNDAGVATISGKFTTQQEKYVSVMIFAPDMNESNIAASGINQNATIPFVGSTKSNNKGEFTMEITLKGTSGEYSAYFGPSTHGEAVTKVPVYFWNKPENTTALSTLNTKAAAASTDADITDVENFVSSNADALAFRFSLYEGINSVNHTEVIKTLITDLKEQPFDTDDTNGAAGHFRTLVFARALTEAKITDLDTYVPYLPIFTDEDALLKDWYDEADSTEKAEIITRLTNLTYTTKESFEKKAIEMAILTRIHNADGDGEVRKMLTGFENYTGIATSGLKQAVYDGLERENIADYTALKLKIEELKKIPEPDYNPPLGGGLPSASIQGEKYTPVVNNDPVVESKGFSDVTENDWYYDAVYELYDRGIIAGKGENAFAPNDSITREEIVKMLVIMENITLDTNDVLFRDVNTDDWFFKYVNAAAKYGIVNGVGDGVFGAGQNVTRQDIAVMLYNIATKKGISAEITESTFGDADSISNYAVDAVKMLSELKVINGYDDLTFRPLNFVTRAEAAKLIREFIYINR